MNWRGSVALVAALIIVAVVLLAIQRFGRNQDEKTRQESIQDSIIHFREMRIMHHDSAMFYDSLSRIANEKYINYGLAAKRVLDSLRADYGKQLKFKIRTSAPGHSDTVRKN